METYVSLEDSFAKIKIKIREYTQRNMSALTKLSCQSKINWFGAPEFDSKRLKWA